MNILAYVDRRYLLANVQALPETADILISPPFFSDSFPYEMLCEYDVIYLDLHGEPGSVYLYSGPQANWSALAAQRVGQLRLERRPVVFATTCHMPETPFVEAFLKANAAAVIAGSGKNYAGRERISGAQRLLQYWLIEHEKPLNRGIKREVQAAQMALSRDLKARLVHKTAVEDALEFQAYFLPGGQVI